MTRTIYINDQFVSEQDAKISIFDRGFLFADAIYEVSAVVEGRLVDNDLHLTRLERSLGEIDIPMPMPKEDIIKLQAELIRRNNLREGVVYIQITRGTAERDFGYAADMKPNFVMLTQVKNITNSAGAKNGIAIDLAPDNRWTRRDIKTTMLLAQVLAKKTAHDAGYQDVWLVEDNHITEGGSSSAFIITKDNVLITRPNSNKILPGCTRKAVLKIAEEQNLTVEERLFTPEEAFNAKEAFLTSASSFVTPVIRIQEHVIADGRPGPLTLRLQEIYMELARTGSEPII
ncbi:D-amino-acid transaminase [Paenochrobactrum glaciei]|uniref:Probable branched-chain-amino-acid aminotransferase n=1 Tax=Paenochrobactrum glaciei TaxID=486407 RepID=A0ABN1FSW1_9HYPH